jgi:hypothetical protein
MTLVLYGFGTWSVTLMEEQRLRVVDSRVLRKVFGPKREEVAGGWAKLCNLCSVRAGSWWANQKNGNHCAYVGVGGKIMLK